MGQFLQKTNIIRDLREDFDDKRRFWPKEIWSKHVDNFDDLFDPRYRDAALACSSEIVLNALGHIEDCLSYMAGIKEQGVFNFVAIPQTMAIATLELVFQNPRIFQTNVKITRGETVQLLVESSRDLRMVCAVFKRYVRRIRKKNTPRDPNFLNINTACGKIQQFIESMIPEQDRKVLAQLGRDGGKRGVITEKAKAIDDQAKSYFFHLLIIVLGTLFFLVSHRSFSRHKCADMNQDWGYVLGCSEFRCEPQGTDDWKYFLRQGKRSGYPTR